MDWKSHRRPARAMAAMAAATVLSGNAPGIALAAPGRHPAYAFTSLLKPDFQPIVGAMDWMPDGKLALATLVMKDHDPFSGPSDVFILDGALKDPAASVTARKYASGFYTPLGLKVVDGIVYVLDNKQGLLKLVDADKDGFAEGKVAIWEKGIKESDRKWAGGLEYAAGFFYAAIGAWLPANGGGSSGSPQPAWRGTLLKIARDGSQGEPILGGLRNPNGIAMAPGGGFFITDNQGSWLPASKVIHALPGEFHGHAETPFADRPVTPPLAWLPHGELARSPSTPVLLSHGPYSGHMLVGEVTNQAIFRLSLEKVGGRLQGCAFPFAWDMPAGVNRMLSSPDGTILVGGAGGTGGWTFKEPWYDLERMVPTGETAFEMFAVRSLGPKSVELEFTRPLAADMAAPAHFQARQWRYAPTSAYGGPKVDDAAVPVASVRLSPDGLRAVLELTGLKTGHVLSLRLKDVKSKSGEIPWATDAYYTLNAFGPADATVGLSAKPAGAIPRRGFDPIRAVSADGREWRDFTGRVLP